MRLNETQKTESTSTVRPLRAAAMPARRSAAPAAVLAAAAAALALAGAAGAAAPLNATANATDGCESEPVGRRTLGLQGGRGARG